MMFEAVENFLNTEEFLEMLNYPYKTCVSNFNDSFYPFINKDLFYEKNKNIWERKFEIK